MNFAITLETDSEAQNKSRNIISLSVSMKEYFKEKEYGNAINNFYIGCICVKLRPGYEEWYKIRKPIYKESPKVESLDGNVKELTGVFSYDIRMDYQLFMSASDEDCTKLVASEILKSLSNLDALPKKVKDFDKTRFKADMEYFFKNFFGPAGTQAVQNQ